MVSAAEASVEKMQGKVMHRAEEVCESLDAYYMTCKRDYPNDKDKLRDVKKMVEARKILILEEAEKTAAKMSAALDLAAGDSSMTSEAEDEGPPNVPSEDDSVDFTSSDSESVTGAVDSDAPTSQDEDDEDDDDDDDLPADEAADSVPE